MSEMIYHCNNIYLLAYSMFDVHAITLWWWGTTKYFNLIYPWVEIGFSVRLGYRRYIFLRKIQTCNSISTCMCIQLTFYNIKAKFSLQIWKNNFCIKYFSIIYSHTGDHQTYLLQIFSLVINLFKLWFFWIFKCL